jgi:hypothetical protein
LPEPCWRLGAAATRRGAELAGQADPGHIPFTAGSTVDIVGHRARSASALLAQPIVVENRGAGGTIEPPRSPRRSGRLHDPDQRVGAFRRARRLSERALRHGARFLAVACFGSVPTWW